MILLLIVVLFVGLVQWRAHIRETNAEMTFPPSGQFVEVDGVPVHVCVGGTGPDLVLLHGASGNLRDFTFGLTGHLKAHYRVIAFDRPGLGWSGRKAGYCGAWNAKMETPMEQAAILQNAADQLGVVDPIVLGHSYGGAVALAWGLSRPDQTAGLVLVSAVSEPWPGDLGWLYRITSSRWGGALVIPLVTAFLPDRFVKASLTAIFAPQEVPEGYAQHIGPGLTLRRETTRANAQQVNKLFPHIVEMQTQYSKLTLPVELVHGTEDTIVPMSVHADAFLSDVPTARLTRQSGMGHMPHHSDPHTIVDAIDRVAQRAGLR